MDRPKKTSRYLGANAIPPAMVIMSTDPAIKMDMKVKLVRSLRKAPGMSEIKQIRKRNCFINIPFIVSNYGERFVEWHGMNVTLTDYYYQHIIQCTSGISQIFSFSSILFIARTAIATILEARDFEYILLICSAAVILLSTLCCCWRAIRCR